MYKLLLLTLLTTLLFSQNNITLKNPMPYAALGDVIYNNEDKIANLKHIDAFSIYSDELDTYIRQVNKTKTIGYDLEKGNSKVTKKEYLNDLRELSVQNDYYLRAIKNLYKESLKSDDYNNFTQIINCKLIDTEKHKEEIISYHFKYAGDINASGIVEKLLLEDAALKAKKKSQYKNYKSKKALEAERIRRIRQNDIEEKLKLEEKLQKDLVKKKIEIRENQKKELAN